MVPNNFEENIKDKLENRTIQPSNEAWSKLKNRLDETQEPKNNKPFFWIGLAASIVGVLFVVSQFFGDAQKEQIEPAIVINPEVISNSENNPIVVNEPQIKQEPANNQKEREEVKLTPVIEQVKPQNVQKDIKSEVAIINETKIVVDTLKNLDLKKSTLSFEDQKIQDVVAQIQVLKDNKIDITDADLELLLKKAQQDINTAKLYNEQTGIVDARALLEDVEADLDRSFRDKVFKALKENFNFISTAVANRNN